MATSYCTGKGKHRETEKKSRRRGLTFILNDPPRTTVTRDGLHPRVVWLPSRVIDEHDQEAGQLTTLMTAAVDRYLRNGDSPPISAQPPSPSVIHWTRTRGGNAVDLLNPNPKDICIEDIAAALSQLCRFAGHTSEFYSVAQHSVIVSRLCPAGKKLSGLLHDAAEAFINDIPTPIKSILSPAARAELKAIEGRLLTAIGERFRVDLSHDAAVKRADLLALRKEAETFLPEPIAGFADLPSGFVDDIIPWRPAVAEKNFLVEFRMLAK